MPSATSKGSSCAGTSGDAGPWFFRAIAIRRPGLQLSGQRGGRVRGHRRPRSGTPRLCHPPFRLRGAGTTGRPGGTTGGTLPRNGGHLNLRSAVLILTLLPLLAARLDAQRPATPDDFPGLTFCEDDKPATRLRPDITDSLLLAQLRAHEAVHRAQASAFGSCDKFLASLTSARRIVEVELPAYCAQWRVAVSQGQDSVSSRRDFAWRLAAQSGAMENRLQVTQRMELECPLVPDSTDATRQQP